MLQQLIDLDDEYPKDKKLLVWLETPLNPTGEVLSIEACTYHLSLSLSHERRRAHSLFMPKPDSKKAHEAGGVIAVDSTFAPPPIQVRPFFFPFHSLCARQSAFITSLSRKQDPFRWGADYRIDSGTKYFGGASDLLSGTIAVKDPLAWKAVRPFPFLPPSSPPLTH